MPEHGATLLERFTVPVASLAFGCLRFMYTLHRNNWIIFDFNEDGGLSEESISNYMI
jgi:hypothetical protein